MSGILNTQSVAFLRWGALGVGIWYGAQRQASLTQLVAARHAGEHAHQREIYVEEALLAYQAREHHAREARAKAAGVVVDPTDYKFTADKAIDWLVNDMEKHGA
ncbi:hypothetical protein CXG81DRAFT_27558 [Caulochytrium protostelioides]|uniref:ATP synthase F(0) complex subunit e, mitochondrial n=1 Tax=Caulochytrium protostelioides TaxID=1555241 RepID=A0A4P9X3S5_9FUNG|nr:hypothetical protein CXG81DRAFT_27558 [Caulochytrium protostelioides]|eukprot:RKO99695.1 hypothetical protein CXG81DRAFT_27558 [Caulochytrium protostelioides]